MISALSSLVGSVSTQIAGGVSAVAQTAGGFVAPLPAEAADFGSVLAQVAGGAVNTLNAGEATAISGLEGKASVQDVVKSVLDAQQAVQTVVAIRDKVVQAYQDIMRMTI